MHTLKLKSQGFLLGRIVGWSQWEGNISFFILGLKGGGGRGVGDFFKKNYTSSLCGLVFFVWTVFFFFLFIYLFIIIISFRDCPFLVFGARGGKKGAFLGAGENPLCKCNERGRGGGREGGRVFFPVVLGEGGLACI